MQEHKAVNIKDSFMNNWLFRHGLPKILISEGGKKVNGNRLRHQCII